MVIYSPGRLLLISPTESLPVRLINPENPIYLTKKIGSEEHKFIGFKLSSYLDEETDLQVTRCIVAIVEPNVKLIFNAILEFYELSRVSKAFLKHASHQPLVFPHNKDDPEAMSIYTTLVEHALACGRTLDEIKTAFTLTAERVVEIDLVEEHALALAVPDNTFIKIK